MLQKHGYSHWLMTLAALLMVGSALTAKPKFLAAEAKAMREKMDMMEKMELADHLDAASACASANNFSCA